MQQIDGHAALLQRSGQHKLPVRGIIAAAFVALAACQAAPPSVLDGARDITGRGDFAAVARPDAKPEAMFGAARALCEGKALCKVMIWTDAGSVATAMPMTDREASALAASYTLNRNSGMDEGLVRCGRFGVTKTGNCFTD